jgi:hypothetical protein
MKTSRIGASSKALSRDSDDGWGTVYRVGVDQIFKGSAPKQILFYSARNSGGFDLDDKGSNPKWLLFLDPIDQGNWASKALRGLFVVNYSCGQSRQWAQASADDRRQLATLAAKARETSGSKH